MKSDGTFPLFDRIDAKVAKRRRRGDGNAPVDQPDLLDLPSLRTIGWSQDKDYYRVEAEPSARPDKCAHCGMTGRRPHRHDLRRQVIKDVPIRGKRVVIHLACSRFKCRNCGQVNKQSLDGVSPRKGMTMRLEEYIEQESLRPDKNFRLLADEVGVDEKTVRNINTRRLKRLARSWKFEAPRFLGIDEVYIGGVARCILTDVENKRLVNLLHKRDKVTVRRHLLQIKHPERIEVVVMDMYRPYFEEVSKRFPRAVILIDVYHVLRLATNAVIAMRTRLRAANKRLSLPKPTVLRKRLHDILGDEKSKFERQMEELPLLAEAYKLREDFFNIWSLQDRSKAEEKLDEWVGKIPDELHFAFKEVVRALRNWKQEILNYFDYFITNAFTESVNNIIKAIQRDGRGYKFDVVRARLVYSGPFVVRRPSRLKIERLAIQADNKVKKKKSKKSKRSGGNPSSTSNVRQLTRIRLAEDEFRELMRPPAGYIERFKHFKQLDFDFYD